MRGFCSRCKEYRGDRERWGIVMRYENFPLCAKCGGFVDVFGGDED
jgi:hypothetical protein